MTLDDKIAWMEHYGRVTFHCKIADTDPYITWTAVGNVGLLGTANIAYIKVDGDNNVAIHDLYDAIKNRLFKLCLDNIQNVV